MLAPQIPHPARNHYEVHSGYNSNVTRLSDSRRGSAQECHRDNQVANGADVVTYNSVTAGWALLFRLPIQSVAGCCAAVAIAAMT